MAVVTRPYKVDDLEVQSDPAGEVIAEATIRFAVNGAEYEIDLSDQNARTFLGILRPYQEAGRRIKGAGKARPAADREQTARIREWAKSQPDITLSDFGRLPGWVIVRYNEANPAA